MEHKLKRLKLYYLDIAVKLPVLTLLMAAAITISLYLLAKHTEFYEYKTQEAAYTNHVLYTDYNKHIYQSDEILFYTDKNVLVSKLQIEDIKIEDKKMAIKIDDNHTIDKLEDKLKGFVDIPSKRVDIFQKIFSQ